MPPDLLNALKQVDPLDRSTVPAHGPQAVLDRILATDVAGVSVPTRRRVIRPRLAVALAVLFAVLAAAAFTPPGRAIAERIGEWIGIGDEPSGSTGFGDPAVVIGTGESPDGFPYQVVAARADEKGAGEAETCVGLDLPGLGGGRVAECLTAVQLANLEQEVVAPVIYAAPPELGPSADLIVQGLVRPDAAEVEVSYQSGSAAKTAPTQLVALDSVLGEEIGASERADFFAAFIPEGVIDPVMRDDPQAVEQALAGVRIVVRAASGEVLAEGDMAELARTSMPSLLLDPPVPPMEAINADRSSPEGSGQANDRAGP